MVTSEPEMVTSATVNGDMVSPLTVVTVQKTLKEKKRPRACARETVSLALEKEAKDAETEDGTMGAAQHETAPICADHHCQNAAHRHTGFCLTCLPCPDCPDEQPTDTPPNPTNPLGPDGSNGAGALEAEGFSAGGAARLFRGWCKVAGCGGLVCIHKTEFCGSHGRCCPCAAAAADQICEVESTYAVPSNGHKPAPVA
jgi:hypothetical protein